MACDPICVFTCKHMITTAKLCASISFPLKRIKKIFIQQILHRKLKTPFLRKKKKKKKIERIEITEESISLGARAPSLPPECFKCKLCCIMRFIIPPPAPSFIRCRALRRLDRSLSSYPAVAYPEVRIFAGRIGNIPML